MKIILNIMHSFSRDSEVIRGYFSPSFRMLIVKLNNSYQFTVDF